MPNQGPPGSVPGTPFAPGEDERRGAGKKGRSGRPANDVRELFVSLLRKKGKDNRDAYGACGLILSDPAHPQWSAAFKTALAYAYGQPKATVTLDGDVPVIRIVRDQAAVAAAVESGKADDA